MTVFSIIKVLKKGNKHGDREKVKLEYFVFSLSPGLLVLLFLNIFLIVSKPFAPIRRFFGGKNKDSTLFFTE